MMILDRIEVLTDANEESPPKEITMPYFNSNRLDKTPPMTLHDISQKIAEESSKTILIYGFNGVGKTQLSRSYSSEKEDSILYYNAFTEDLFYWDNDLINNSKRVLKIHPNNFTNWILNEEGLEDRVIELFQSYTSQRLTPKFYNNYSEVSFSIATGDKTIDDVKISKGEESCFIWCIFYVLIQQIIVEEKEEKEKNSIKHIFIDDPVTSLDEEHLIELAVDIANTIKSTESIKFIITTHNPLFYNILCNHLSNHQKNKKHKKYILNKTEDGLFSFDELKKSPLSYHLHLLDEINKAIETNTVKKYHFNLLRNLLEKISIFLGYPDWKEILKDFDSRDRSIHVRTINLLSHSDVPHEEVQMTSNERTEKLRTIIKYIENTYKFYQSTNKGDSLR